MANIVIVDPSGNYRNDLGSVLSASGHRIVESVADLPALERSIYGGLNLRQIQAAVVSSPREGDWWKISERLLDGNPKMSIIDDSGAKPYGITLLCVPQIGTAKDSIGAVCQMVNNIFQPVQAQ